MSQEIPEHAACRWEAAFKEACDDRDARVGALTPIADLLLRAVPQAEDSRACIAGALLQVYEQARRSVEASVRADCEAQRLGSLEMVRRGVQALLDAQTRINRP
jgi:hypothetical protein